MFTLLKKKNPHKDPATAVYARLLLKSREPGFYTNYGVPDTFDGRFDLLVLHSFLVVNRLKDEGQPGLDFNQALFDALFADMDQTLRQGGIGDMGVPKRMRKMMKAFNGRMHAYDEALKQGEGGLAIALRRNLYGTLEDEAVPDVRKMVVYVMSNMEALSFLPVEEIVSGEINFANAE